MTPSLSATAKQADPSSTTTASASAKPGQSSNPRPSIYPRQKFNLVFQNVNNTLIRSSPKLQQLQTALACVAQTPLESIELTTISAGSTSLPFTRPQDTGAPNCSSGQSGRSGGRRLQATTETTVSFDLLNAPYVNQTAFQTDPNVMSFASSVGTSGQVQGYPAYVPTPNNTGAIYGGVIGALCAVGVAVYGIMYIRSQRARRPASSKPKIQSVINPFAPNNRISYSPAVVKMSRSNSV
jgi:hypothetical protein